jgi:hypothetical protein
MGKQDAILGIGIGNKVLVCIQKNISARSARRTGYSMPEGPEEYS